MEALYKIQEEDTTGWVDITQPLTKEVCRKMYENQLNEGTSPDRLRIIRVS